MDENSQTCFGVSDRRAQPDVRSVSSSCLRTPKSYHRDRQYSRRPRGLPSQCVAFSSELMSYRAVSGRKQAMGRTAGEALNALASQLPRWFWTV
jgi:hypothetical protein